MGANALARLSGLGPLRGPLCVVAVASFVRPPAAELFQNVRSPQLRPLSRVEHHEASWGPRSIANGATMETLQTHTTGPLLPDEAVSENPSYVYANLIYIVQMHKRYRCKLQARRPGQAQKSDQDGLLVELELGVPD